MGDDPRKQQSTGEERPGAADVKKGYVIDLITAVGTWNGPAKDCEEPFGIGSSELSIGRWEARDSCLPLDGLC